jgi:hypothetical protein
LKLVIAKINGLMADRGFPLKDLESALITVNNDAAEERMLVSKSGAELAESPIDKIRKISRSDIIMELTWTINQRGPFKSISFIIRGIDAYTNKQVAYAVGTGPENSAGSIPLLLETAVLAHLDNFNSTLQAHFADLFTNGREINLKLRKWDSFEGDFEKEYDGIELGVLIENWVSSNSIKGRYNISSATESIMNFEQLRIPLFDDTGKALDARSWARGLQKNLKEKLFIDSKIYTKGLGEVIIIVGEK